MDTTARPLITDPAKLRELDRINAALRAINDKAERDAAGARPVGRGGAQEEQQTDEAA